MPPGYLNQQPFVAIDGGTPTRSSGANRETLVTLPNGQQVIVNTPRHLIVEPEGAPAYTVPTPDPAAQDAAIRDFNNAFLKHAQMLADFPKKVQQTKKKAEPTVTFGKATGEPIPVSPTGNLAAGYMASIVKQEAGKMRRNAGGK